GRGWRAPPTLGSTFDSSLRTSKTDWITTDSSSRNAANAGLWTFRSTGVKEGKMKQGGEMKRTGRPAADRLPEIYMSDGHLFRTYITATPPGTVVSATGYGRSDS